MLIEARLSQISRRYRWMPAFRLTTGVKPTTLSELQIPKAKHYDTHTVPFLKPAHFGKR